MNLGGPTGISGDASVKHRPWLFLSGIVFFFSLIFFRLSCEQDYYESGFACGDHARAACVPVRQGFSHSDREPSRSRHGL
jgi:hypothetical protein